MRNVKRLSAWILTIVIAVSLFALVACVDKPQAQELTELIVPTLAENQMAVIIQNSKNDYTSVTVTLGKGGVDAKTAEDVLAYLKKEGAITLKWHDTEYGKYIDALGKITPSTSQWVAVFTSNSAEWDTSAWAQTRTAGDVTLTTSIVGVSELSVAAGRIIYFELGSM